MNFFLKTISRQGTKYISRITEKKTTQTLHGEKWEFITPTTATNAGRILEKQNMFWKNDV